MQRIASAFSSISWLAFLDNPSNYENSVFLDGYLCGAPVFRRTPLGRWITDLTIAVNYPFLESDYIPCICLGRNALAASTFPCGTHINAWGRIQSREYLKKISDLEISSGVSFNLSPRFFDFFILRSQGFSAVWRINHECPNRIYASLSIQIYYIRRNE